MTAVLEARPERQPDTDDLLTHIVEPASEVTRAYIEGTEVTALCGKTWVPTRDPARFPLCRSCAELAGWEG